MVKASFERGPNGSFPNYPQQIRYAVMPYFASRTLNYIIGFHFTEHLRICKKVINASLLSFSIDPAYYGRPKGLDFFLLNLMIIDIHPSELEKLLQHHEIKEFVIQEDLRQEITESLMNYLLSRRGEKILFSAYGDNNMNRALTSDRFNRKYHQGFENLLIILARCNFTEEVADRFLREIGHFIDASNDTYGQYYNRLSGLLTSVTFGHSYSATSTLLKKLLKNKQLNHYESVTDTVEYIITNNAALIQEDQELWSGYLNLINNDEGPKLSHLTHLYCCLWPEAKVQLQNLVKRELLRRFSPTLYSYALTNGVLDNEDGEFAQQFNRWASKPRSSEPYEIYRGVPTVEDGWFIRFLLPVYARDIEEPPLVLEGLSEWQVWALNPEKYPAERFEVEWLHLFYSSVFHNRFAKIPYVVTAVKDCVRQDRSSPLVDVYLKYYI